MDGSDGMRLGGCDLLVDTSGMTPPEATRDPAACYGWHGRARVIATTASGQGSLPRVWLCASFGTLAMISYKLGTERDALSERSTRNQSMSGTASVSVTSAHVVAIHTALSSRDTERTWCTSRLSSSRIVLRRSSLPQSRHLQLSKVQRLSAVVKLSHEILLFGSIKPWNTTSSSRI